VNDSESGASGRGAFAEFKESVGNLFESVVGMAPDFGLGREFPRHELRVEDDGYVVSVELPGMARESVEVSVSGRTLSITGKRARFEAPSEARMIRSERPSGKFDLSVRMPDEVDTLGVIAKMRDGVLEIRLPRPSAGGGRSIEVEPAEAEANRAAGNQAEAAEQGADPEEPFAMPWEETAPAPDEEEKGADKDE
jgi:HSP20 family protein